jgi:hypothetical protein
MYNSQLIWYNKEDVLNLFDIKERTYFRKLKQMSPHIRTKKLKNPNTIHLTDATNDTVLGKMKMKTMVIL